MVNCYTPSTLKEALQIRKDYSPIILAGGSDLMVSAFRGIGITPEFSKDVMIIRGLSELTGINKNEDGELEIGACTVSREIASSELVPWVLRQAAGKMGAIGLRNSATIGGNVANASPKGDTPGPLYLLDARVRVRSTYGMREVPIEEFVLALKKVDLRDDEIITHIVIPYSDDDFDNFFYHKIGRRRANAISKLTFASAIKFDDEDKVADFRLATTACGVKTNRSREVEEILIGKKRSEILDFSDTVASSFDTLLTPRAMPEYRKNATANMIKDFIHTVSDKNAPKYNE